MLELRESIETCYYMFWKIVFALPMLVRVLVELLLIYGCLFLIYRMGKCLLSLVCRLLQVIVYISVYFFREVFLVCCLKIFSEDSMERLIVWDDASAEIGLAWTEKLNAVVRNLRENKIKEPESGKKKVKWKKIVFVAAAVICLWRMLPTFFLIKNMNETYHAPFYFMDNLFHKVETALAPNIEKYPDIFLKKENVQNVEEEEKEEVYLKLNAKGSGGAHIREIPSLQGQSLKIVTEADALLYRDQFADDGERYWLLISTDDVEEGWISGNLIEEEQMKELGLNR